MRISQKPPDRIFAVLVVEGNMRSSVLAWSTSCEAAGYETLTARLSGSRWYEGTAETGGWIRHCAMSPRIHELGPLLGAACYMSRACFRDRKINHLSLSFDHERDPY